jgi:hypothetical protein
MSDLYDSDFFAWANAQAALLRSGDLAHALSAGLSVRFRPDDGRSVFSGLIELDAGPRPRAGASDWH